MLSEEYFPPERRDQFIFRGKKVNLIYLLVNPMLNIFIARSSLNAKSTTITKKPFDGFLITSSNTLLNPVVVLLKLVNKMLKRFLGYVLSFLHCRRSSIAYNRYQTSNLQWLNFALSSSVSQITSRWTVSWTLSTLLLTTLVVTRI